MGDTGNRDSSQRDQHFVQTFIFVKLNFMIENPAHQVPFDQFNKI